MQLRQPGPLGGDQGFVTLVRRQTRTVVGQLLPSLVAGLLVTIALTLPATGGIVLLLLFIFRKMRWL